MRIGDQVYLVEDYVNSRSRSAFTVAVAGSKLNPASSMSFFLQDRETSDTHSRLLSLSS